MKTIFDIESDIFVACPKRMTPFLRKELEDLGYQVTLEAKTGVQLRGTMEDCIELNLRLRTAYRVLFFIKKFRSTNPNELYKEIRRIEWENILHVDGYFTVESFADNETIVDTQFPALRSKDAIADRFVEKFRKRPDSGSERDKAAIYLFWRDDEVSVYVDTSGETLSKHGYRKLPFKAPLMEALAASTIIATGWNQQGTFINPMCGSGTLAIEAALLASKRTPGLLRDNYGFMHIKGFEDRMFVKARLAIKQQVNDNIACKIIASDINEVAIDAARRNAQTAEVEHLIDFHVCDFRDTPIPDGGGILMLNPEYGLRLGNEEALEEVYKSMGDFFKQKCKGYRGYIFTGNLDLAKRIGLKANRRIEFYNSRIDCRLLEYEMYDGTRRIASEKTIE